MIAALIAAAAMATEPTPPAPPQLPMMQVTISPQDLSFLEDFLSGYAGQGCNIQTQQGVTACQSAVKALDVWQVLRTATPVVPTKGK